MIHANYEKRINSFFDIQRELTSEQSTEIEFKYYEKEAYQEFANKLSTCYSKIYDESEYVRDIDIIINDLDEIYRNSMLENDIQNHIEVARCFVKGKFKYYYKHTFEVFILRNFLSLIKSVSKDKQKIILNNLWKRLDSIERISDLDNLPF